MNWLASSITPALLLGLLIYPAHSAMANEATNALRDLGGRVDSIEDDHNAMANAIGTPEREEVEVKLALKQAASHAQDLSAQIKRIVEAMAGDLSFGSAAGCLVKVDKNIQSFAFVDEYFDTDHRDLLHHNASYRIRKRWQKYQHYLRHKLYFWSRLFPPTRLEIQAKTGYRILSDHQVSVMESRLEFRPQSPPFNEGWELPDITTISDTELHGIMTRGTFAHYPTRPYASLLKDPNLQKANLKTLSHRITLLSKRNRFHLRCAHPLGSGPNPDQIFIVTLDEVRCLTHCCGPKSLMTIEMERERNASVLLSEFALYEQSGYFTDPIALTGLRYARTLQEAHVKDHQSLITGVKDFLDAHGLTILPPAAKYHRFSCDS